MSLMALTWQVLALIRFFPSLHEALDGLPPKLVRIDEPDGNPAAYEPSKLMSELGIEHATEEQSTSPSPHEWVSATLARSHHGQPLPMGKPSPYTPNTPHSSRSLSP